MEEKAIEIAIEVANRQSGSTCLRLVEMSKAPINAGYLEERKSSRTVLICRCRALNAIFS